MFLINLHISSLKLSSIYQSYIYSFLLNLLYFQKNNEKKINFSNLYIQEKRIEITAEIVFLFHYISIVILLFCSFFLSLCNQTLFYIFCFHLQFIRSIKGLTFSIKIILYLKSIISYLTNISINELLFNKYNTKKKKRRKKNFKFFLIFTFLVKLHIFISLFPYISIPLYNKSFSTGSTSSFIHIFRKDKDYIFPSSLSHILSLGRSFFLFLKQEYIH